MCNLKIAPLKTHHAPRKHYTNSNGWDITTSMHNVVFKKNCVIGPTSQVDFS